MKDLYDGQTYDLKKRIDIWTRVDVVPVEYGTFPLIFNLEMWFFQFITGINFKWDYVMFQNIDLLMWIGLWTKLKIYRLPPDPVRWSCQCFVSIWQVFMISWMLFSNNELMVYCIKQVNSTSDVRLETSLMNLECQPCGISECILNHKEDEAISPTTFAYYVGLGDITKKLVAVSNQFTS